jgi:hypothetical protein
MGGVEMPTYDQARTDLLDALEAPMAAPEDRDRLELLQALGVR